MNKLVDKIFEHPIITIFIIVALFNGVTNVIKAVKGDETKPMFSVTVTDTRTEDVEETKGE